MPTIPMALSDLADRLEKFRPMQVPEGDEPECWSIDVQLAGVCCNDSAIHDALQLYESVEFASAFKERCDHLYKLAKSNDPNAMASLARMISVHARYCRSLAEAIEGKCRANPPVWNVPSMLAGMQPVAGDTAPIGASADRQPPEDQTKAIPKNLKEMPSLDKTNKEWVKQADAATDLQLDVQTLANDRLKARGGLKTKDGLSGIDRRGRSWRKERLNDQIIWYLNSSLSSKPT